MDPVPDELRVQERRLEPVAQLRMSLTVGSGGGESSALARTRGNANSERPGARRRALFREEKR
jgi:hypothetical protein